MLDARQIRDAEFIKNSVKRRAKTEAQQFLERTAGAMEQLQNENASVRAENIDLNERCARLAEVNEKLQTEKDELLQKLSGAGAAEISDFANNEIAAVRAENAELCEDNARLREQNAKLGEENEQLIQKSTDFRPEADIEQENAIAAVRAENAELSEDNARLRELIEKLEDEKDRLIQKSNDVGPAEDVEQENAIAAVRAENAELCEDNTRLKELNAQLEGEKEQLIQKLAHTENAVHAEPARAPVYTESERMIKAAQDKAALILEKAERDYLLKMTRANAVITQKTIAVELEFRDNLRKLRVADGELRELKARLTKLLEEMPDGLGENASEILDRLKNQEQ